MCLDLSKQNSLFLYPQSASRWGSLLKFCYLCSFKVGLGELYFYVLVDTQIKIYFWIEQNQFDL